MTPTPTSARRSASSRSSQVSSSIPGRLRTPRSAPVERRHGPWPSGRGSAAAPTALPRRRGRPRLGLLVLHRARRAGARSGGAAGGRAAGSTDGAAAAGASPRPGTRLTSSDAEAEDQHDGDEDEEDPSRSHGGRHPTAVARRRHPCRVSGRWPAGWLAGAAGPARPAGSTPPSRPWPPRSPAARCSGG